MTAAHIDPWWDAGCLPLPVAADGTKRPLVDSWRNWQTQRPARDVVDRTFRADTDGIGIVCGSASGNLEMLEFEGRAIAEGYLQRAAQIFTDHGQEILWHQIINGYAEQSPSGGLHLHFRTDGPTKPNTKLARRPSTPDELEAHKAAERAKAERFDDPELRAKRIARIDATSCDDVVQVLIETRGQGGFTIVAPSHGRTHPTGRAWLPVTGSPATIPTITSEQRDIVHNLLALLDETPQRTPAPTPTATPTHSPTPIDDDVRPGDDFNNRSTWADILTPHGWQLAEDHGREKRWTRPGKRLRDGISATTGHSDDGVDRLYVFSTNAYPFEQDVPYTKFGAYALLEHGGDHSAAAVALRKAGYGTQDDGEGLDQLAGLLSSPAPRPTLEVGQVDDADENEEPEADPFWDARPILRHIHTFALSRLAAPAAVLAVTLARALQTVPPMFVLPPVVGGDGSLNALLALVGKSGSGKGAAMAAARGAVQFPGAEDPYIVTIGSGEGIAHQYAKMTKNGFEWIRHDVLFETSEIDSVAAIQSRQGSTLMEQLRKAFSGEPLGFAYANAEKRILIPAHSYRFGFICGVQPEKSHALLGDADGGTPQRFIWTSVTDSTITADPIETPEPWTLDMPRWVVHDHERSPEGRHIIAIPDDVAQQIRDARVASVRGVADPLDGHRLFVQEKAAVAFAILDSRHHVTDEDWELAGRLMQLSDRTREFCQRTLQHKSQEALQARIASRVRAESKAAEDVENDRVERCATAILTKLEREGGEVSVRDIQRSLSRKSRGWFDDALLTLLERGVVETNGDEKRMTVKIRSAS